MKDIKRVHIVYKTHLDLGFTDLSKNIIDNYLNSFIPKAIELANSINTKSEKKFIWTVGSWLIDKYLKEKQGEDRSRLINAINNGDIVWHGLPFTTHSELMTLELFQQGIVISNTLDEVFNKKTVSAKMTDVPGHTRGIIEPLVKGGIKYLHIGVNDVAHMPEVPDIFIWKDSKGNEIVVNYCQGYGDAKIIDGLDEILVFAHTGDNLGPPSKEFILENIEKIKILYPNAIVEASTLDNFANSLLSIKDSLPVVTEELGDTWIHGVASDPKKVSSFLELLRLVEKWNSEKRISKEERGKVLEELLMIPEHTWGVDLKKYLSDYRNWDKESFEKARKMDLLFDEYVPNEYKKYEKFAKEEYANQIKNLPWDKRSYSFFESSHEEQRNYINTAISYLNNELKLEATRELKKIINPNEYIDLNNFILTNKSNFNIKGYSIKVEDDGSIITEKDGRKLVLGKVSYEVFGLNYLERWKKEYYVNMEKNELWAIPDNFKVGVESSKIPVENKFYYPKLKNIYSNNDRIAVELIFSEEECKIFGCPRECIIEYILKEDKIEINSYYKNKSASRIPEALWISNFVKYDIDNIILIKMKEEINYKDVIKFGNRNYHCAEEIRIESKERDIIIKQLDSPLVSIGEKRLYNFNQEFANINGGIHTNLYNNLWGTNFKMWYEEDILSRFIVKLL